MENENRVQSDEYEYKVNKEKARLVEEALKYSFKIIDFVDSIEVERKGNLMSCLFHGADSTPSLRVDIERNIFKCFGCGIGGSSIKFYQEYVNVIEGKKLSYYQTLELMLKMDPQLHNEFGSIFIVPESDFIASLDELKTRLLQRKDRFELKKNCNTDTVMRLRNKVIKMDVGQRVEFCRAIQNNRDLMVLKAIANNNPVESIAISDLIF